MRVYPPFVIDRPNLLYVTKRNVTIANTRQTRPSKESGRCRAVFRGCCKPKGGSDVLSSEGIGSQNRPHAEHRCTAQVFGEPV
jgi:hypothetical protein